jgi:DNA primase
VAVQSEPLAGLVRVSGHEHLAGSLVIPVLGGDGTVCEAYGRKIRDDLRAGTPAHLYLPGPHRGVWNLAALAASDEVILAESLIDALTFWCAGFRHVTRPTGRAGSPPTTSRRSPGTGFGGC